jgi:imidazolonepropionase-like amidohydrolase
MQSRTPSMRTLHAPPCAVPPEPAQLVYRNSSVLTLDDNNTLAQAVAVRDKKIVAIGTNRAVNAFVGAGTKVVDLQDKTLIPGIYDAHSHFTLSGTNELFAYTGQAITRIGRAPDCPAVSCTGLRYHTVHESPASTGTSRVGKARRTHRRNETHRGALSR